METTGAEVIKRRPLPDSGERSEFETGSRRDSMVGKGSPSQLPIDALRGVSRRFEDGSEKYGRNNWRLGQPSSRYIDSIYRHLWDYIEGCEEEDHLSAVIWNAMCLYQTDEWIKKGKLPESLKDV
jgi:hypothetical protein